MVKDLSTIPRPIDSRHRWDQTRRVEAFYRQWGKTSTL